MKTIGILAITMLILVAFAGVASALPASITSVEINDDEVFPDDTIRLDVERAGEIEIEVLLMASQDIDDVQVKATLFGYEYSDFNRVSDSTHNFDMDANVSYKKKLSITLPDDIEEDDYKLRIVVADRYGSEIIENYNLKIDVPRHKIVFDDVTLRPGNKVKAGSALITVVRLDNRGERDEDNVKVTASVDELGLSDTIYVDEIEYDEQEETEELYLRIPNCAEAGLYELEIEVEFDRGHESISTFESFQVLENDACSVASTTVADTTATTTATETVKSSALRTVLETVLLVLIALLVIIGLIIGFSKLKADE